MNSQNVQFRLSGSLGVDNDGGDVTLYDIRAYTAAFITMVDWAEMQRLIVWYTDGLCPICGEDINVGEVICDDCFEEAARFPPRQDALLSRK